ncbi:MAG: hypothetical protein ACI9R3_006121 [Verrucomicrobiales bacterium]|jgi:hypothetical protein
MFDYWSKSGWNHFRQTSILIGTRLFRFVLSRLNQVQKNEFMLERFAHFSLVSLCFVPLRVFPLDAESNNPKIKTAAI